MAKLEVFKGSANDLIAMNHLNKTIQAFIKNKKVVSTDVVNIGAYIFTYVWYEE